jgi:hypothetical protein
MQLQTRNPRALWLICLLHRPLVIHSRNEKKLQSITYDTDRVIMLQDYYHDLSTGLLRTSLSPGSETDPIPDGALINGSLP